MEILDLAVVSRAYGAYSDVLSATSQMVEQHLDKHIDDPKTLAAITALHECLLNTYKESMTFGIMTTERVAIEILHHLNSLAKLAEFFRIQRKYCEVASEAFDVLNKIDLWKVKQAAVSPAQ